MCISTSISWRALSVWRLGTRCSALPKQNLVWSGLLEKHMLPSCKTRTAMSQVSLDLDRARVPKIRPPVMGESFIARQSSPSMKSLTVATLLAAPAALKCNLGSFARQSGGATQGSALGEVECDSAAGFDQCSTISYS